MACGIQETGMDQVYSGSGANSGESHVDFSDFAILVPFPRVSDMVVWNTPSFADLKPGVFYHQAVLPAFFRQDIHGRRVCNDAGRTDPRIEYGRHIKRQIIGFRDVHVGPPFPVATA